MDTTQTTIPAIYDTLAAVRRLTGAGFSGEQAVALVYERIYLLQCHLAHEAEVERVRLEPGLEGARVSAALKNFRNGVIIWAAGAHLVMWSIFVALVKLL